MPVMAWDVVCSPFRHPLIAHLGGVSLASLRAALGRVVGSFPSTRTLTMAISHEATQPRWVEGSHQGLHHAT